MTINYNITSFSSINFSWSELAKFYSENYGIWATTRKPIRLPDEKFLRLHDQDNIACAYRGSGEKTELLGFICIEVIESGINYSRDKIAALINCLVVRKDLRRNGIGTELVKWFLEIWKTPYVGVMSANPITLHILQSACFCQSEITDYLMERFKTIRDYLPAEDKQINTFFPVLVDKGEIDGGLLDKYESLYGLLDIGYEWLIFFKTI